MSKLLLYTQLIAPWQQRRTRRIFIADRVGLVTCAVGINLILLHFDVLPHHIPELIINDIASKQKGYLYTFQTLVAAVIAFLAARYAYLFSVHDKNQRSFIATASLRLALGRCKGTLKHIAEYVQRPDIIKKHLEDLIAAVEDYKKSCDKIDVYSISPEISIHILNCSQAMESITINMNRFLEFYDDIPYRNKLASYIQDDYEAYLNACVHVNDFIRLNYYKFPPHLCEISEQ